MCMPMGVSPNSAGMLKNVRVLVTRPAHQAARLCELIEQLGGTAVLFPVVEILDPEDLDSLRKLADRLHEFAMAIFISANAVTKALQFVLPHRIFPAHLKLAAVGARTAEALQQTVRPADIVPRSGFNSEALLALDEMNAVQGKRIVIFRGAGGRELLAETLRARGAYVEYVEVYRRAKPQGNSGTLVRALERGAIDVVTVTSNEGLCNLVECMSESGLASLRALPLVVIGARTAELAQALNFDHTPIIAHEACDEALVEAIVELRERGTL